MPVTVPWQGGERALMGFFDVRNFSSELVGQLLSVRDADMACASSCVDWYGNARPVFWRERIFALLGPELIEGVRQGGQLREANRVLLEPEVAEE